jgi:hypothetical protein
MTIRLFWFSSFRWCLGISVRTWRGNMHIGDFHRTSLVSLVAEVVFRNRFFLYM